MQGQLVILGVLFFNIVLCEWIVKHTVLKHLGTATLVIILTAIVANLGLIPSSSDPPQLYDHIFSYIAPLAIFFLLLECNFRAIKSVGLPILLLFLTGSVATVAGVVIGGILTNSPETIGSFFPQIAGMFTGTYTGGSINFNAVALEYDINKEGNIYAGAVAIDNIWTAIWMVSTIVLPKFLSRFFKRKKTISQGQNDEHQKAADDSETVNPSHLSILITLGVGTLLLSDYLSSVLKASGVAVPSILILTTISLGLAQVPQIRKIKGSRVLGIIGIYLFLAVIGAYCDFSTLPQMGALAYHMLIFIGAIVMIHGVITFGVGAFFKQDWDIIAIASQANIGGSGSALALARSLNREDLLLPAILLGTVGNALGTYLGFMVVGYYL